MSESRDVLEALPCVTAELPGTGGAIRVSPEDFEVEELPAYEPSGDGDHLFLWVEKRGRNTRDVAAAIAAAVKMPEREVGVAGQKDRNALTRQYLSVPWAAASRAGVEGLQGDGWRVLSARRHGNKLKTGHLRGNRFVVRVRGCVPDARARAERIAAALAERGLPNAFGPQRFGRGGQNAVLGAALLRGEDRPEVRKARYDRFLRRIAISAYQSLLFNRVLAERMRDGLFATAVAGDLMKKLDTGGLFTSEDPATDTGRVARFEITPTGPMFGHRMMEPKADALARERRVLEAEGLTLASFAPLKADGEGTRRTMRIPIAIEVREADGALELGFALPKGSFATTVLREVMKTDAEPAADLVDERGE